MSVRRARRVLLSALLSTSIVAAGACGSSNKTGSKASKSSKTVVLMTYDSYAISKPVLAQFTRETGYSVKVLKSGDAGELVSKAILVNGNPVADALFGVDNTFLTRALDAGIF